ncbi:hypothetical protein TNCV_2366111, partial [Trichonephila clavipes]
EPPVKRDYPPNSTVKKKIVGRVTKMPTEQEAKPAVVTPSLAAMEEPIDLPRRRLGRPQNGLKSTIE